MKLTRREFAKKLGGFGVGGVLAFAGCDSRENETPFSETRYKEQSPDGRIKLRRLGRTGLMLSTVGFGAQRTGDASDHREALNWVLSKDYITAAIPGMTTRSQVDLNLKTMSSTM